MGCFKVKQHVVPDFIVKTFADEQGYVVAFNKKIIPIKRFQKTHDEILVKNHANEVKNLDGTFFHRNEIENKFADIETNVSRMLKRLYNEPIESSSGLNIDETVACIVLIALQLVRLQKLRQLIFNCGSNNDIVLNGAIYQWALSSKTSCIDYLIANGYTINKTDFINSDEATLFEEVLQFIINNCIVFVVRTDKNAPFVLTDSPVLIDKFEDAKYIFPISPTIAIVCCLFSEAKSSIVGNFVKIPQSMVEKINHYLCDDAEQTIICQRLISDDIYTYLNKEEKT